jgi:hypothetical protein
LKIAGKPVEIVLIVFYCGLFYKFIEEGGIHMRLVLVSSVLMSSLCAGFPMCESQAMEQTKHKETPLSINGNFEASPLSWNFITNKNSKAYICPGLEGNALCLESANASGRAVAVQKLNLEQQVPVPIVMRGWSRTMSCASGTNLVKIYYSIALDKIIYNDKSRSSEAPYLSFDSGLPDWQFDSSLIVLPKPVKSAELLCRWTNTQGRVLFDSVSLGYYPYIEENYSIKSGEPCELKAELRNPSAIEPYKLKAVIKKCDGGKESILVESEEITIMPGGAKEINLSYSMPREASSCLIYIDLKDAVSGELYFRRKSAWHGADIISGNILREKDGLKIAEISPDSRIYPMNRFSGQRKDFIEISAARGEFESSQLGLTLPDKGNLGFAFTEFRNENHKILDTKDFKVEYVDYVNVKRTTSGYRPDSYPDKLVPAGNGKFSLPSGSSAMWLTFYVPRDTVPGIYSGMIEISGGFTAKIPVKINVLNFTIPAEKNITLVPGFSRSDLLRELPGAYKSGKLAEAFYKDLDEHFADYVDLYFCPNITIRNGVPAIQNTAETAFSFKILKDRRFKYIRLPIPMFGDGWGAVDNWEGTKIPSPEFENLIINYSHFFQKTARENGCHQKFFYRVYDEPKDLQRLEYLCELIRRAVPGVPILSTNRLTEKGEFEKFKNCIDISCPHIIYMSEQLGENIKSIEQCNDKEKKLFIYHNHLLLLDYQRLNARALAWVAYRYHAQGILLWSINAWRNMSCSAPNKETLMNGYQYTEGVLVYPGKDSILVSVRWQLLREGLEDFEYLKMLEKLTPELKDRPELYSRAVKLLDNANKIICDWQNFSRNYGDYQKIHHDIGTLLNEASRDRQYP